MKWIHHKKNALTKDQCDFYIKKFDNPTEIKWFGPHNDYCDDLGLYYYEAITLDIEQESIIAKTLEDNIFSYTKKHNFLIDNAGFWGIEKYFNLQKFKPGMSYNREHCEDSAKNCRVLAWMFYLNTVKHGGETYFPQQNFKAKPRCGDLYIWPSGWTHSHKGLPAKNENKYIITGWYAYTSV